MTWKTLNFEFPDKLKINWCKSIHEYKGKIKKMAFLIKYRADTADSEIYKLKLKIKS